MPKASKVRHVRVPDQIWDKAYDHADSEGINASELIRILLREYNEKMDERIARDSTDS